MHAYPENFVRKRAVSQIDRKQWGTKRDLDRFYVNSVLRDQTARDKIQVYVDERSNDHEFSAYLCLCEGKGATLLRIKD